MLTYKEKETKKMKTAIRVSICMGLMVLMLLLVSASTIVYAGVPSTISFQGYLTDHTGEPVADGTYTMNFYLFDAQTGGSQLWNADLGEQQTVTVTSGIYNVQLGAIQPLSSGVFAGGAAWLEVAIYNEGTTSWETLVPRQPITSTAFSLKAGDADTLNGQAASAFGDITGVTAGTGLSGGGTSGSVTISASTSFLQRRIMGTCPTGSSIRAVNEDGTVTCEADDTGITAEVDPTVLASVKDGVTWNELSGIPAGFADSIDNDSGGDITGVTAGAGLDGGGTAGTVSLSVENPLSLTNSLFASATISGFNDYSTTGYGIVGNASGSSGRGVYGISGGTSGIGVYGSASNNGTGTNCGGYFTASGSTGRGVYAYASGTNGYGIYAVSSNGDGIYGATSASDEHAGSFYSPASAGLTGAVLYARNYNSAGEGIALWAHNDYSTSADATAVLSNDGTGPLLKGFGGSGGEDEFRFDNDGTLRIYNGNNTTHTETIVLDPSESGSEDGGQITLYNGSGSITAEFDGDYNDYGHIRLMDTAGSYRLSLTGDSSGGGAVFLRNADISTTVSIYGDYLGTGDGRVVTDELQITGGSDLSEQFDVKGAEDEVAPGMVVSIDSERPGQLTLSQIAYDNKVAGIISGAGGIKPGMMMGQQGTEADGRHPVALTGRVYCWADTSAGPIQPGDLLTTSSLPGHAMKVTDHMKANGAILGKAMTALVEGKGLVLVLVSLQ